MGLSLDDPLSYIKDSDGIGIVDAILNQPALSALSTNARAAWFLLAAIFRLNKGLLPLNSWRDRLAEWTPLLVSTVAASYVKQNALRQLSNEERRRLAASVLHCIETCRRAGDPVAPMFVGLTNMKMESLALALIELNVEYVEGVKKFACTEEKCAALLSPATTLLLFFMLGIPAGIMSSSKTQELTTALYMYRSLVFDRLKQFCEDCDQN
jgi:hypothetical protein